DRNPARGRRDRSDARHRARPAGRCTALAAPSGSGVAHRPVPAQLAGQRPARRSRGTGQSEDGGGEPAGARRPARAGPAGASHRGRGTAGATTAPGGSARLDRFVPHRTGDRRSPRPPHRYRPGAGRDRSEGCEPCGGTDDRGARSDLRRPAARLPADPGDQAPRMAREFPTVADLLALAVAAGESPIAAMERVARTSTGALPEEFATTVADIRAGTSVAQALTSLGSRTPLTSLGRFGEGVAIAI